MNYSTWALTLRDRIGCAHQSFRSAHEGLLYCGIGILVMCTRAFVSSLFSVNGLFFCFCTPACLKSQQACTRGGGVGEIKVFWFLWASDPWSERCVNGCCWLSLDVFCGATPYEALDRPQSLNQRSFFCVKMDLVFFYLVVRMETSWLVGCFFFLIFVFSSYSRQLRFQGSGGRVMLPLFMAACALDEGVF